MGNKAKKTPPKAKTQANQVIPSGVQQLTNGTGVGANNQFEILVISLVKINLVLMKQVHTNTPVEVAWQDGGYYCFYNNEVLGKIPGNYNSRLNAPLPHSAIVVELKELPPTIKIEISI